MAIYKKTVRIQGKASCLKHTTMYIVIKLVLHINSNDRLIDKPLFYKRFELAKGLKYITFVCCLIKQLLGKPAGSYGNIVSFALITKPYELSKKMILKFSFFFHLVLN